MRRVGEWEVALALLHQMFALDYEPDSRILGSVISVVGSEVRVWEGQEWDPSDATVH